MGNNRRENLVPDPPLEKEEVIEMDKSDVEGDNWEMPSDSDKLYDTPLAMAAEAAAEPEAPPEPEPPPEDPKIATMRKVIEAYIATRDKLKEMKTAYETSIAELKQYQENRELWLQQQLTEMGVQSARTDAGTSYKSIVKSATVADQEEFINWILEAPAERISCMDVKASKSTISEMVEDGKLVPPGINWKTFEKVMVRR